MRYLTFEFATVSGFSSNFLFHFTISLNKIFFLLKNIMSFGNVPRDLNLSSLLSLRYTNMKTQPSKAVLGCEKTANFDALPESDPQT